MKKILFPMLLLLLVVVACKEKKVGKTAEDILQKPSVEFTSNDTADVLQLVNQYVDLLTRQNYDSLIDVLYVFNGSEMLQYEGNQRDSIKFGLSLVPVYDAKLSSIILRGQYNNAVGLTLQIRPDGNLDEQTGVTKFYLNPVKYEDKWYLTILDKEAQGYEDVYQTEE